ncbi:deleted in malignant brain tumors 1 protein isoform X5 [Astyanax mexicanus]|uniref:deleted in malignant brain tumors 1 protein isoform X5 n=1 Tax=Astyanax mexicanus TaxID=7994 RepID=UPI0020CB0B7D|nr:deleted in malignant brain tumors 1 protein isoform X5 [Astyanax mexicanus]
MLTAVILMVLCSTADSVRLVDGVGSCSGRLEVETRYSWTTVCETDFDWRDAVVLCRELNCGTPVTLQGALFGDGNRQFGYREFQCEGTEKSILNCNTLTREGHTCVHGRAVGLICSGVLVKPSISFSSPKTISTYFPKQHVIQSGADFNITCSTLPQFQGGSFKLKVPWNNEPYTQHADNHLASYLCPEAENMYHEGNYSCIYENHVNIGRNVLLTSESETHTVFIQGPYDVRLVGGSTHCNGTVEMPKRGRWRKVSAMDMDPLKQAAVVCRQLNCGYPVSATTARATDETWQFLSNCSGSESALGECKHVIQRPTYFTDTVVCSGPHNVRLVNGNSRCNGTVEMFHTGQWRKVSAMGKDPRKQAYVVCRQLDCGYPVSATTVKAVDEKWQILSNCSGSEYELIKCEHVIAHRTGFIDKVVCLEDFFFSSMAESPPRRFRPPIVVG